MFLPEPVFQRKAEYQGHKSLAKLYERGFLKPDTISFGQAMPVEETQKAKILSSKSDVFIVVGSTLLVQPASLMPKYAKNAGAFLVIINLSETPYDKVCDILIRGKAGEALSKIVSCIN